MELNKPQTLTLVVDMVKGFAAKGVLASPRIDSVTVPIAHALKKLDRTKIIFINDCHTNDSAEFDTFPPHCHNEEECAVCDILAPFASTILKKNSTNGIFTLLKNIDLTDFDDYIITGCCTDICILQLALSLKAALNESNLSSNVHVFKNLCETFDAPNHSAEKLNDFAYLVMAGAGIKVTDKF